MPAYRLSILHISDLHARSTDVSELPDAARERRLRQVSREAASRNRVLGDEWDENLRALYPTGVSPDLVCFTGDVADWGLRSEYTEATKLVRRLVDVLGIERSQIYVVPGNHDVRRTSPKRKEDKKAHKQWEELRTVIESEPLATSNWLADGPAPRAVKDEVRETVMGRTAAFWQWVEDVEHGLGRPELLPARNHHGRLGYHHVPALPHLPFRVHVIGLDSAWLAGDDHDQGKLWLTQHQRDMLLCDPDGDPWEDGFRLALIHHPIHELAQPEHKPTLDALARSVNLLLHGHQHDAVGITHLDLDDRVLRVLAAGCLFEGTEGSRYKNGCHRIDIALDGAGRPLEAEIHFRAWSSHGYWHSDTSLYRNAKNGRMTWPGWGGDAPPPTPRIDNLGEHHVFQGRDDELEQMPTNDNVLSGEGADPTEVLASEGGDVNLAIPTETSLLQRHRITRRGMVFVGVAAVVVGGVLYKVSRKPRHRKRPVDFVTSLPQGFYVKSTGRIVHYVQISRRVQDVYHLNEANLNPVADWITLGPASRPRIRRGYVSMSAEQEAIRALLGHNVEWACRVLHWGLHQRLVALEAAWSNGPDFRLLDFLAGLSLRYRLTVWWEAATRHLEALRGLRYRNEHVLTRLEHMAAKWNRGDSRWRLRWSNVQQRLTWTGVDLPPADSQGPMQKLDHGGLKGDPF